MVFPWLAPVVYLVSYWSFLVVAPITVCYMTGGALLNVMAIGGTAMHYFMALLWVPCWSIWQCIMTPLDFITLVMFYPIDKINKKLRNNGFTNLAYLFTPEFLTPFGAALFIAIWRWKKYRVRLLKESPKTKFDAYRNFVLEVFGIMSGLFAILSFGSDYRKILKTISGASVFKTFAKDIFDFARDIFADDTDVFKDESEKQKKETFVKAKGGVKGEAATADKAGVPKCNTYYAVFCKTCKQRHAVAQEHDEAYNFLCRMCGFTHARAACNSTQRENVFPGVFNVPKNAQNWFVGQPGSSSEDSDEEEEDKQDKEKKSSESKGKGKIPEKPADKIEKGDDSDEEEDVPEKVDDDVFDLVTRIGKIKDWLETQYAKMTRKMKVGAVLMMLAICLACAIVFFLAYRRNGKTKGKKESPIDVPINIEKKYIWKILMAVGAIAATAGVGITIYWYSRPLMRAKEKIASFFTFIFSALTFVSWWKQKDEDGDQYTPVRETEPKADPKETEEKLNKTNACSHVYPDDTPQPTFVPPSGIKVETATQDEMNTVFENKVHMDKQEYADKLDEWNDWKYQGPHYSFDAEGNIIQVDAEGHPIDGDVKIHEAPRNDNSSFMSARAKKRFQERMAQMEKYDRLADIASSSAIFGRKAQWIMNLTDPVKFNQEYSALEDSMYAMNFGIDEDRPSRGEGEKPTQKEWPPLEEGDMMLGWAAWKKKYPGRPRPVTGRDSDYEAPRVVTTTEVHNKKVETQELVDFEIVGGKEGPKSSTGKHSDKEAKNENAQDRILTRLTTLASKPGEIQPVYDSHTNSGSGSSISTPHINSKVESHVEKPMMRMIEQLKKDDAPKHVDYPMKSDQIDRKESRSIPIEPSFESHTRSATGLVSIPHEFAKQDSHVEKPIAVLVPKGDPKETATEIARNVVATPEKQKQIEVLKRTCTKCQSQGCVGRFNPSRCPKCNSCGANGHYAIVKNNTQVCPKQKNQQQQRRNESPQVSSIMVPHSFHEGVMYLFVNGEWMGQAMKMKQYIVLTDHQVNDPIHNRVELVYHNQKVPLVYLGQKPGQRDCGALYFYRFPQISIKENSVACKVLERNTKGFIVGTDAFGKTFDASGTVEPGGFHHIGTTRGTSGAPVYVEENGTFFCVGVHCMGSPNKVTPNSYIHFTEEILNASFEPILKTDLNLQSRPSMDGK